MPKASHIGTPIGLCLYILPREAMLPAGKQAIATRYFAPFIELDGALC
jgi:hypothetical protein